MTTRCFCSQGYCDVPGPTIITKAGTTINIILSNKQIGARHNMSLMNHYKDLDVTNLHTHGLHIDPAVDDMFIHLDPIHPNDINQGQDSYYQKPKVNAHKYAYEIISEHESGTHWWHSHWFGIVL